MKSIGRKRAGGLAHWFNGNGPDIEKDTITCCHCSAIVYIEPMKPVEDFTGWCMRCMKFVCKACEANGACVPFEKRLDQMEARR